MHHKKSILMVFYLLSFCSFGLHAQTENPTNYLNRDGESVSFSTNQYDIETVIEGQLSAIKNGEISRAYFTYGAKPFRDKTTLEDFKKFILNYKDFWNHYSFDWTTVNVVDDVATIKGVLISETDKKKLEIQYTLVREGGRWKVLTLRLSILTSPYYPG